MNYDESMKQLAFTVEERQLAFVIVNEGDLSKELTLSPANVDYILHHFNIKVFPSGSGWMCYFGHKIGECSLASTSGAAFFLFLRLKGLRIAGKEMEDQIIEFCSNHF